MKIKKRELLSQMKIVAYGKKELFRLIKKYDINLNMDFIIVLPEACLDFNILVLLYLNMLVKQFEKNKDKLEDNGIFVVRENEKFLILTMDKRLFHDAKILFPRASNIEIINEFDMHAIMARYCLMPINGRVIMASIKEMNGINYEGLLNKRNVDLDELIAVSILGIERKNFMKWKKPQINMELLKNEEVLNVMRKKG